MATTLTRAQAAAALDERKAERDRIQANLQELDASFGWRLLSGAPLAGTTKQQWEAATGDLAAVLASFDSYSAVLNRVAKILDNSRWPGPALLAELTALLTGPSVALAGQDVPFARRQLTASERPEEHVTLDVAVERMSASFGRVNEVVSAAENVWTDASSRLDQIAETLAATAQHAAGLGDDGLIDQIGAIDGDVRRARDRLSSDPLASWHDDQVDVADLVRLGVQAQEVAGLAAELAELHANTDRRVAEVTDRVAAAQACEQDARVAYARAAAKIATAQLPPLPPSTADLSDRLTDLARLRTAGRLQRLASELALVEAAASAAAQLWTDAGTTAGGLLDRRAELRGLLEAYQAKAGQLGGAEDPELTNFLQVARDLLWSAPCDLDAAAEAVRSYQNAILVIQRGKP